MIIKMTCRYDKNDMQIWYIKMICRYDILKWYADMIYLWIVFWYFLMKWSVIALKGMFLCSVGGVLAVVSRSVCPRATPSELSLAAAGALSWSLCSARAKALHSWFELSWRGNLATRHSAPSPNTNLSFASPISASQSPVITEN